MNVENIFPLTPLQEGMLFQAEAAPDSAVYWNHLTFTIEGELRPDIFARAWEWIVEAHAALRTRFVRTKTGKPVQIVQREARLNYRYFALEDGTSAYETAAQQVRETPPDLTQAPLMAVVVGQVGQNTHVVQWSQHHIILDGWSWPIILRELFTTYETLLTGGQPRRSERPAFSEYVGWIKAQNQEEAREFWRQYLSEIPAASVLREPEYQGIRQADRYAREQITLSPEDSSQIREFCRSHRLTVNSLVQCAWGRSIAAQAGATCAVIGTTQALRPGDIEGVEQMVGMALVTVPYVVELASDNTVGDWLRQQQSEFQSLSSHAHCALTDIADVVGGEAARLFDSIVVFENFPFSESLAGEDTTLKVIDLHGEELTGHPLTLQVIPLEQMEVTLTWDTSRIAHNVANQLWQRFRFNLRLLMDSAGTHLKDVPQLSATEYQAMRKALSGPELAEPPVTTSRIHEQVRRGPGRTAVVCARRELTYETLWAESGAIAAQLEGAGVASGDRVAVGMTRGSAMVAAILGIWRVGAAYVPVDPSLPERRATYILETARVQVVVTNRGADDVFAGLGLRRVLADDAEPAAWKDNRVSSDDLAYVMFTSGSTGEPNGVMIRHKSVSNFLESMRERPGFAQDDRLLAVTTLSFDISVLELFLPLIVGGTTVIAEAAEAIDGELLQKALQRSAATVMQATPVTWNLLMQSGWNGDRNLRVFCGGEALSQSLADQLAPRVGELWNLYGPTETTVWSACGKISSGESVHVGSPLAQTHMMIVNATGHPVPRGTIGELLIGGAGVSEGYLGNPSLTESRFEVRSGPNEERHRWFRTGDLASLNEADQIVIHGRRDHQIKLRGYRIETGDVESHLSKVQGIKQCAVALVGGGTENARLVAFVVVHDGGTLDEQVLREHLADRLPSYMIPQTLVPLDALPLTHNLKVDYGQLPRLLPDKAAVSGAAEFSDTEARVAAIWEELLGVRPQATTDDFMQLGGHSLLLAKLANRLKREFKQAISISALLESPLLGAHARLAAGESGIELPELLVAQSREQFPLSSFQRRLWFLEQLEAARGAHNLSIAYRLPAQVDEERLLQALCQLARRHEVLRTRFDVSEGVPLQEVLPEPQVDWGHDKVEGPQDLQMKLTALASQEFDLAANPPWLARVLNQENECVLILVFHHLIMDGESMPVLLSELAANYDGTSTPESPVAQYGDFAAWQFHCQELQVHEHELAHWQKTLAGTLPVLRFPTTITRPPEQQFDGGALSFEVDGELLQKLHGLCRKRAVSMNSVLLASFVSVLLRYCNQNEVIVGMPLGTVRHTLGVNDGLGPYLNTVALRLQAADDGSFPKLLAQVVARVSEAIAHGNVPFESVVAALQLPRDLSRTPVFQTLFSYRQSEEAQWQLANLKTRPQALGTKYSRTDLTCWIEERPACLAIELEYASALFDPQLIEGFANHLLRFLALVTEHEDLTWRNTSLLNEAEIATLAKAAGPARVPGQPAMVSGLVWPMVEAYPDRIAVASNRGQLTYKELKLRCESLSTSLATHGIGGGALVALALSRSEQLPAVMLALWELGAAFLPLDLELPDERLKHILDDSGVTFVLCERGLENQLPKFSGRVLQLDQLELNESAPAGPESSSPLAYLIYTSGSTGLPKGVRVGQSSVVNLLTGLKNPLRMRTDDVLAAITTTSFDISILELLLPLTVGAQVYVVSEADSGDGRMLAGELERCGATMMQGTPASWRMLLNSGWSSDRALKVLCGGEALPFDLAETLLQKCGVVFNLYGPTETTVWSSVAELQMPLEQVVIGTPLQNTRIYVVDTNGHLVPDGVEGELLIAGDGVALGYHNQKDLTEARFVADPFDAHCQAYLTGDLGRRLPNGCLEHLGRLDTQLKVRGYRIEAGDVESHIRQAPGVVDVAVCVGTGAGQDNLLAFVVTEQDHSGADAMAMRRFLQSRLPRYMIPQQFITLEALPLTPNQKVDYSRLPTSGKTALLSGSGEPPTTAAEKLIAGVWKSLLGVETVSVEDNFFELGGHSLLAVKAAYEIEQACGIHLPAQDFVIGTLKSLAAGVGQSAGGETRKSHGGILKPLRGWLGRS